MPPEHKSQPKNFVNAPSWNVMPPVPKVTGQSQLEKIVSAPHWNVMPPEPKNVMRPGPKNVIPTTRERHGPRTQVRWNGKNYIKKEWQELHQEGMARTTSPTMPMSNIGDTIVLVVAGQWGNFSETRDGQTPELNRDVLELEPEPQVDRNYYDLREANLRQPKTTVTDGEREEPTAMWRDERQGGGTNDDVEPLMARARDHDNGVGNREG
ncbi:hypothetical protein L208DRAFT_1379649 [Tricholoma matsutake]|nr:hypothetical protein L208DRAFT_1379649 [Tricholoma matsutake 945]